MEHYHKKNHRASKKISGKRLHESSADTCEDSFVIPAWFNKMLDELEYAEAHPEKYVKYTNADDLIKDLLK